MENGVEINGVPAELNIESELKNWLKWDQNSLTRKEILQLIDDKNYGKLKAQMCGSRLSFGTAGIRAKMAAGFSCLNDLTIIEISQAMLRYMQKECENLSSDGIVIGFDVRHNSEKFAKLTASIFLRENVKVFLFRNVVPTPLVSYAVTFLKCAAGIMVTASHNPSCDNGFKVYWKNGAQILSPIDKGIEAEILKNQIPWENSWDFSLVDFSPICLNPMEKIFSSYRKSATEKFCFNKKENFQSKLKFTYTPFHGVGIFYVPQLFQDFGFRADSLIVVEEQAQPDPDFSTVKFPNPEEGRPVLKLAFETAEKSDSRLVFATDPDADRFQMAERLPNGEWYVFSGNEQGGLLAWWIWEGWKKFNPGKTGENVYMLNSAVSSKLMKTIADAEGFNYEETLTGFKYMGNRADFLRKEGKTVLLAWEESIGYMCGDSLDKDGVLAALMFAEMAVWSEVQGRSLTAQLDEIYQKYGYHLTYISYFLCYDPEKTAKIFERIRNWNGKKGEYPEKIGNFGVKFVRDLTFGFDSSQADGKPVLPVSKSSQMITFTLENGSLVTVRASGTEPKIKFYIEVKTPPKSSSENAAYQLNQLKISTAEELLQPSVNGLIAKED